jgi:hypothetical protein
VGDTVRVRGQRSVNVVAAIREMKQVAEEPDVRRVDPVKDGNDVTGRS